MPLNSKVRCENCGRFVDSDDAIFSNSNNEGFWKSVFSVRKEHWICKDCHQKLMDLKSEKK